MSKKFLFYGAATVGSIIGAYIPLMWGASVFSYSSVLFSGIGGILGIVIVWKFLYP